MEAPITVVAFHDIKAKIYVKAKQRADDYAPEDLNGGEDNEDEDGVTTDVDGDFEFDKHADLSSPFLCNMLSGERPVSDLEGVTAPTTVMYAEMRNRELTEEWKNIIISADKRHGPRPMEKHNISCSKIHHHAVGPITRLSLAFRSACSWSLPLLSNWHVLHFDFNECPIDTHRIFYTQGVLFHPLQRVYQ